MQLAQIAALGSHTYILEDGPELSRVPGSPADEGGAVLEWMYANGCTTIEESRILGQSGRAGVAQRITLRARGSTMSLAAQKYRPIEWDGLTREAAGPDVSTVQQTWQFEFTAMYNDEARGYNLRFMTADRGE
jgi:hypothetical protein